ncbi:hypothetical protein FQ775_24130 [Nitratireductor mangrovi]|uniref:Uncharacterized protein n=1 Tax=Nitratireductor mangrovi TaxID=2599600 RepID=A0A6H0DY89_9HYPH|nr:hypothetical protein [Nitratireductor mangrovi]QIS94611.1 hypothetical protein FQ775_24130 [Nitratireductor mangrovi]
MFALTQRAMLAPGARGNQFTISLFHSRHLANMPGAGMVAKPRDMSFLNDFGGKAALLERWRGLPAKRRANQAF